MPYIEIIPYTDRWPEEFESIRSELGRALGDLALRIDHIGSTSVPGLAAKDIIDVQVAVAALEPIDPLAAAATSAGYLWRREIGPQAENVPADCLP